MTMIGYARYYPDQSVSLDQMPPGYTNSATSMSGRFHEPHESRVGQGWNIQLGETLAGDSLEELRHKQRRSLSHAMKTQHIIWSVMMLCSCAPAGDQSRQRAVLEGILSYDLERLAGTEATKSIHVFDMRTKRGSFQLRWVRPNGQDLVNATNLAPDQVKVIAQKWCKAQMPAEIIEEAACMNC